MKSKLVIDGHVHIYPFFDIIEAIQHGINNLQNGARQCLSIRGELEFIPVLLLTERYDCSFFQQVRQGTVELSNSVLRLISGEDNEAVFVLQGGKPILYILAGRQIVTKEGLEVLCLASTHFIEDRKWPAGDVIKSINDHGGVAAINWAPGKWFFKRGQVVRKSLEQHSPESLLICDTALRTNLWPRPELMKTAEKKGFKIIAGSDPLPFHGEERYVGSYGFAVEGHVDLSKISESVCSILRNRDAKMTCIGRRNSLLTFILRQWKIMNLKRKGVQYEKTAD